MSNTKKKKQLNNYEMSLMPHASCPKMCDSSVKFRWTLISLREIGLLINHTRIFMKKISHIDIYICTHILELAHTLSACTIWVHQNLDSMKKKQTLS